MENKLNQNLKGMNLDSLTNQVEQGEVTWALNANIQSIDGSRFAYTNELGNQLCTTFRPGFQVVGQPYYIIESDIIIFALYNPDTRESEIGKVTAFNKDCLDLVSKVEDCGCGKGDVLEDEIVVKLTDQEIPCEPIETCRIYRVEPKDPVDTGFFNISWKDCDGVLRNETLDGSVPFRMKSEDDLIFLDSAAKLKLVQVITEPCTPEVIKTCCRYETVLNAPCLNFSVDYPVWFKHKTTACDTLLYFVSKNNPPRRMSLSLPKGEDACGNKKQFVDCNELDLFPKTCHPDILPIVINDGGSLTAGSYRFTLAYSDRLGNELTDYFDMTSEVPVFDRPITFETDYPTSKSIQIKINHNTDVFDYYNLVAQHTINTVATYYLVGTFRVAKDTTYTYTGNNKEPYSSVRVLNRTPRYETAGIIEDSDDILFLADLEGDLDYNLQPLANQIKLYWETVDMPAYDKDFNYSNGIVVSNFRGYMRDEVYPFGIKFKLKTGKYTKVYHIPGRAATPNDLASAPPLINGEINEDLFYGSGNCPPVVTKIPTWKVYNTATVFDNLKTCPSIDDEKQKQFSCAINPHNQGEFAYWESTVTYPCNEDIWGDLAGQPIRLHKFPECATGKNSLRTTHIHNNHTRDEDAKIYPIGVRPDLDQLNSLINEFRIYNPKTKKYDLVLKDLICGFELVRGSRIGNKSVIAKGLTYDVGMADDNENNRSYYFPNYPYNDTRDQIDPYLSTSSEIYTDISDDRRKELADLKQYFNPETRLRYTFHSPDTHFQFPQLGTEIKIESCEKGRWRGHFAQVDQHPKYKYLTKYSYALSALLGTIMAIELTNKSQSDVTVVGGFVQAGEVKFNIAQVLSNITTLKETIETLIPEINYAWSYQSVGKYTEASFPERGNRRRILDIASYLSPNNQTIGDNKPIWNYQRESSVYLKLNGDGSNVLRKAFKDVDTLYQENSRYTLSSWDKEFKPGRPEDSWCANPTQSREGNLKSNYVSIKRTIEDQYGPIENFVYVNTGDFYPVIIQPNGQGFIPCKYYPTFGGDIFINSFSLKRKMPFFTQNMVGRPDRITFDYQLVPNVLYPTYFSGTSPATIDLSIVEKIGLGSMIGGFTTLAIASLFPEGNSVKTANLIGMLAVGLGGVTFIGDLLGSFVPLNNLDCDTTPSFVPFVDIKNLELPKIELDPPALVGGDLGVTFKKNTKGAFYQDGKFYLSAYGIPTFFVESDVNVDMRHGRNDNEENFYPNVGITYGDWLQESRVPIKFDNYYSYNSTYSKQNFENYNEPYSDFKPDEICSAIYYNRVIYSDPSSQEEERDSWRLFRTNNYYDFPKTNGKLIALNAVENEKILARFENTTQAYNSRIVLDSSYPVQIELGTGSMFSQRPIEYVKADLGYVGSQHKAYVSCKYGSFWTDAKRGFIYQLSGSSGFDEITKNNFNWFKRNLPFRITEDFPTLNIDNSFKDVGIAMVWDERFERVFISKKDYKLKEFYSKGPGKGEVTYSGGKFFYLDTEILLDMPEFFENKSWTVAYSPITKGWISFYSFLPNYYVGLSTHFQTGTRAGLWNHLISPLRYQTFYNKLEPYILEYSVDTLPQVSTVNSVTLFQDIQKFYNNTDFYSLGSANTTNKVNFNKAVLYNKEQCSGTLYLVPENPVDLSQRTKYPRIQSDHIEVLYSHREQKFTFNGFWDLINWTSNNQPIFTTDWTLTQDSYYVDKVLNPKAITYQLRQGKQMPLKSTHCRVRLTQDKHSRYRFISILQNTQTNPSII